MTLQNAFSLVPDSIDASLSLDAAPFAADLALETFEYTPFDATLGPIEMRVTRGDQVAVLTPVSKDHLYDSATLQALADALSEGWDFYAEFTGQEPILWHLTNIDGLGTFAEVPDTCGYACGYLGFTGIEAHEDWFQTETHDVIRDQGVYPHYLFYELGRNFWFYGDQLGVIADGGSDVATMYAVANRYLAMEANNIPGWDGYSEGLGFEVFRQALMEDAFGLYLDDPTLNWSNTVAIDAPAASSYGLDWLTSEMHLAALFTRIYEDFGKDAYGAFWQYIGNAPESTSFEEATDLMLEAAQAATGVDYGYVLKEGGESFVIGTSDDDDLTLSDGANRVALGFSGSDEITGGTGDDLLFGGKGDDTLVGGGGADTLVGGSGYDTMTGGSGDDIIHGGDGGIDLAVYSGDVSEYDFVYDYAAQAMTITHSRGSGADGTDTLSDVEWASFERPYHIRITDAYGWNNAEHQAYDLTAYEGVALSDIAGLAHMDSSNRFDDVDIFDDDWYALSFDESGRLVLDFIHSNDEGEPTPTLYDANGTVIPWSERIETSDEQRAWGLQWVFEDVAAGDYLVRLRTGTEGESVTYDMTWDFEGDGTTPPGGTFFFESFETDGLGTRYSARDSFRASADDYFTRSDGSDIDTASSYGGLDGTYLWAAEDTDGGANGDDVQILSFEDIDIAGRSDIRFEGLFGATGGMQFDSSDYLAVLYRIDDGAWQTGLVFRSEGSSNQYMAAVTDLVFESGVSSAQAALEMMDADGRVNEVIARYGDPAARLDGGLSAFGFDIGAGSSLDLIIAAHVEGNHEEIALDALRLTSGGEAQGVVQNITTGTFYDSIAAAVAAASDGDDIAVLPGYDLASEDVVVTANFLTIDLPAGINPPSFSMEMGTLYQATLVLTGEGAGNISAANSPATLNVLFGNDGDNILIANADEGALDANLLRGAGGDDTLIGNGGAVDPALAQYSGLIDEYDISYDIASATYTITHARGSMADGTDTWHGIGGASFADYDGDVYLDIGYGLYGFNDTRRNAFDLSAYEGVSMVDINGLDTLHSTETGFGTLMDEDWFRIDLAAPSDLTVSFTSDNPDAELRARIYDDAQNFLGYEGTLSGLEAGSYYVKMTPGVVYEYVNYDLTWRAEPVGGLPVTNTDTGESFATIAAAVAAAAAGQGIVVSPSYAETAETVTVTVADLSVEIPDGVSKPTFLLDMTGDFTLLGAGDADVTRTGGAGDLPSIQGNDGDNTLTGNFGDDELRGGGGDDLLAGEGGDNRVRYDNPENEYDITYDASLGLFTVTHARGDASDGVDTLRDIDGITFSDGIGQAIHLVINDPYGWTGSRNAAVDLTAYEGVALSAIEGTAVVSKIPNDWWPLKDFDWYRMDLGAQSNTLEILLDPLTEDDRIRYDLRDAQGAILQSWFDERPFDAGWPPTPVSVAGLAAGTYYLTVSASSDTGGIAYDLSWSAESGTSTGTDPLIPVIAPDDPRIIAGLLGDEGDNILYGTEAGEKLDGKEGADILFGAGGDDTLRGRTGDDTLVGGGGADELVGDEGADLLFGQAGDDKLKGREDDDILTGGAGDDRLEGGAGADIFRYLTSDGAQADRIEDFSLSDGDRLDLSDFDLHSAADALAGSVQAGDHLFLALDNGDGTTTRIELRDTLASALGDDDFIFG
ncbi:MAG: hypothetical protein MRY63_05280 [Neomegalonema sp.]|nr:hypothetical protein [Neomegalonema sp.]